MAPTILRARWIFPVASEPIADGAIEITPDGRFAGVHRLPPHSASDLGDVAVVPGFVNAHTHLEFSDLQQPLGPAQPFTAWLRAVVAHRRQRGDGTSAIRRGLQECLQNGTAAVGEIATQDWPQPDSIGLSAVVFRELIGLGADRVEEQMEIARDFLRAGESNPAPEFVRGLTPHAPYSVHPRLFEQSVELAAQKRAAVTVHLAETEAEIELLRTGKGEFAGIFFAAADSWRDRFPHGMRPLDFLRPLANLERVVIAHGNYLDDEEIEFVAGKRNLAVAYCPRTHAFFGHADHPWRKLLARGGLVAIGTDGRCSNPDLSVWNELRFLHDRFPDCDPAALLRMGTLNGARALGLDSFIGTIEPKKRAQGAVIRLGDPRACEPYSALFHPDSCVIGPMPS